MKAKRNARVVAVQVIFQYYFSRSDIKIIIKEIESLNEDSLKERLSNFDKKLFDKIVLGVCKNEKNIQDLIEKNLSENCSRDTLRDTHAIAKNTDRNLRNLAQRTHMAPANANERFVLFIEQSTKNFAKTGKPQTASTIWPAWQRQLLAYKTEAWQTGTAQSQKKTNT